MRAPLMTASDLGKMLRDNRKALGKTQEQIANMIGCRRQTIGDLEAGKNVEIYTLMDALAALGKGLQIVPLEIPAFEDLEEFFCDPDDA